MRSELPGPGANPPEHNRPLTRLDLAAIGVNAIVGSAIYLFPGKLAELLGPASITAFLITALLLAPVALCFAEASSTRTRAGGPSLYAQETFGPMVGFSIGWLCWVTVVVAFAAVASALATYAAPFWPRLQGPWPSKAVAVAAIAALGAVNLRGAKPGARVSTTLTAAKLLPLIAIALAGLPLILKGELVPFAPKGWDGLPRACFLAYFAFQGFEVVPVPVGEAKDPQRNAPFAVLSALGLSAVLYALVQTAALAAVPGLAGSPRPLADAGLALFGPVGERLVAAGALVSMLGFIAGCALGGPRYLVALAEERHFPAVFARRAEDTGAPRIAVLWTAAAALCAALALNFESLVNFANVVIGAQYLTTCAAVLVERARGCKPGFRAPGGPIIPLAGMAATVWLGAQGGWMQLAVAAAVLAAGFGLRLVVRDKDRTERKRRWKNLFGLTIRHQSGDIDDSHS